MEKSTKLSDGALWLKLSQAIDIGKNARSLTLQKRKAALDEENRRRYDVEAIAFATEVYISDRLPGILESHAGSGFGEVLIANISGEPELADTMLVDRLRALGFEVRETRAVVGLGEIITEFFLVIP